jgi:hypothetical protein
MTMQIARFCVTATALAFLGLVPMAVSAADPPAYRDSDQPKDATPEAKLLHFNSKHRVPGRLMVHFIGTPQIEVLLASGANVGELPTDKESAARVATEIADRVGAKFLSLVFSRRHGKGIIAIFDMTDEQAREVANDPRVYLVEPDLYAFPANQGGQFR